MLFGVYLTYATNSVLVEIILTIGFLAYLKLQGAGPCIYTFCFELLTKHPLHLSWMDSHAILYSPAT